MKVKYDLHMHSCLSPCGSDDMTPGNLVNMAALLGFDLIALTDHNTCRNVPAAVAAGKRAGIVVVPGMELCTSEEAHVICLFPTPEAALAFGAMVYEKLPPMDNDPGIFGRQLVMDEDDNILDEERRLLIGAADIGVDQVLAMAQSYGGTAFPAHVDKPAYSVIASLGAIPPEAGFRAAELSANADLEKLLKTNPELNGMLLLRDSDSHYLENMPDPGPCLELPEATPECLIAYLNG